MCKTLFPLKLLSDADNWQFLGNETYILYFLNLYYIFQRNLYFIFFLEELALPRLIRCEFSRLRCHGHSLLLSSYLCRIKRKENSSCSTCGHPLQDLTHLLLDCPASEPLRMSGAPSLALLLPFLTSGPDLGAWPDYWSPWSSSTPPSIGRRSSSTTTSRNEKHFGITV